MKKDYSYIINILSFILPFSNEIANVFTASGLPLFKNLYKQCIDPFILDETVLKHITTNKICKLRNINSKLIIDFIALFGIILYICKNSIEHSFITGVLSGCSIILLSFILPNLFLHKILHFIMKALNVSSPYLYILFGVIIIGLLLLFTILIEKFVILKYTKNLHIYKNK